MANDLTEETLPDDEPPSGATIADRWIAEDEMMRNPPEGGA